MGQEGELEPDHRVHNYVSTGENPRAFCPPGARVLINGTHNGCAVLRGGIEGPGPRLLGLRITKTTSCSGGRGIRHPCVGSRLRTGAFWRRRSGGHGMQLGTNLVLVAQAGGAYLSLGGQGGYFSAGGKLNSGGGPLAARQLGLMFTGILASFHSPSAPCSDLFRPSTLDRHVVQPPRWRAVRGGGGGGGRSVP